MAYQFRAEICPARTKMTTAARIVLVLFLLSIFAGAVTGSQIYFRLSYIWGFLFVGSWIWSRFMMRGVSLIRTPRTTRAQVGQVFEERFELHNPGRLPRLWLAVRDSASALTSSGRTNSLPCMAARAWHDRYRVRLPRGLAPR